MTSTIRLLHLLNNYDDKSNNRLVLDLAKGLDSITYRFHVGCIENAGGSLKEEFLRAGVHVTNFGMRGYFDPGVIYRLREYIRSQEIDIVHTHGLRADLLGWLAVRLAGGPLLVATKHNLNFMPGQMNWFWKNILYRLVLNFPDFVIAVSENLRESLIKTYWLQPRHVVTIHNGINIETFRVTQATNRNALLLRNSWGLSPDDFVVCFTGRLVKEKGLMDLLQAIRTVLALHKKCYLLIVGEGTLLDQLKSKVKELGVEKHVIFAGYRPDIPNILAGIDVLALPSLTEGLPLSILEAMAAGKAVISTPVGGVRELIESGETGILVPTRNPGAMADAIILLLENEQQRKSLGIMARAFVERNFDMEAMLSKYDLVYRKIMRSGM